MTPHNKHILLQSLNKTFQYLNFLFHNALALYFQFVDASVMIIDTSGETKRKNVSMNQL